VQANRLAEQAGVSQLASQDAGADPPVLEFGKDE
jgi:hypothetical protein